MGCVHVGALGRWEGLSVCFTTMMGWMVGLHGCNTMKDEDTAGSTLPSPTFWVKDQSHAENGRRSLL